MAVECNECMNCINNHTTAKSNEQYCKVGMWDREEDEYLCSDIEFNKYIEKERFCTEFKSRAL